MLESRLNLIVVAALGLGFLTTPILAQPTAPEDEPIAVKEPPKEEPSVLQTLQSLLNARKALEDQGKVLEKQLRALPDSDPGRADLGDKLKDLQQRENRQIQDFSTVATGLNSIEFSPPPVAQLQWESELKEAFGPLVRELKDITERPRRMQQVETDLMDARHRAEQAEEAVKNATDLLNQIPEGEMPELRKELRDSTIHTWEDRLREEENRVQTLQLQLEELRTNQPSIWAFTTNAVKGFFLNRGRNLFLAIVGILLTFIGLRWLRRTIQRLSPWHQKRERPFAARLIDVVWEALTVICAVVVGLTTLYAIGDWVLLAIALVLLIGFALAAKHGLPRVYRHARLLLNLGEVRENERVVIDGVPWLVKRLNFYSELTNPSMKGGGLRMPIDRMLDMVSRPHDKDEPWFPCEEENWVMLDDDSHVKVLHITPEFVQVVHLGSAQRTIPVADFLALHPRNLSGGFRVSTILGLDYKHQPNITKEIPLKLKTFVFEGLCELIDHESVRSVKAEFREAGAHSLDIEILTDFDGSVADKYQVLRRAVQRLAVDACNEHDWVIAFHQIVLHRSAE